MKELAGTIEAQEMQLKQIIRDYCNLLGCKECPFKNNCLATTLENSIYEKEKRINNLKQKGDANCNHDFILQKLEKDIVCIKCGISKYLL